MLETRIHSDSRPFKQQHNYLFRQHHCYRMTLSEHTQLATELIRQGTGKKHKN
uniref:Uncharacterized protein n=1 Tax=Triticum urartu TaxID=4572 RepID=A0A8R7URE3_TRIUA